MTFGHILSSIVILSLILSNNCLSQGNIRVEIQKSVNHVRQQGCMCGTEYMPPVRPLAWNNKLEQAAQNHANDMYKYNFFDHLSLNGDNPMNRIERTGYKWSFVGENISWGYSYAAEVVEGWINSPDHCRNMMHPDFKEMGAARKGTYWVLELGERRE